MRCRGADGLTKGAGDFALSTFGCGGGSVNGWSGLTSLLDGGLTTGLGSFGGDGGLLKDDSLDLIVSAISVGDLGVSVIVEASSSSCQSKDNTNYGCAYLYCSNSETSLFIFIYFVFSFFFSENNLINPFTVF